MCRSAWLILTHWATFHGFQDALDPLLRTFLKHWVHRDMGMWRAIRSYSLTARPIRAWFTSARALWLLKRTLVAWGVLKRTVLGDQAFLIFQKMLKPIYKMYMVLRDCRRSARHWERHQIIHVWEWTLPRLPQRCVAILSILDKSPKKHTILIILHGQTCTPRQISLDKACQKIESGINSLKLRHIESWGLEHQFQTHKNLMILIVLGNHKGKGHPIEPCKEVLCHAGCKGSFVSSYYLWHYKATGMHPRCNSDSSFNNCLWIPEHNRSDSIFTD